MIIAGLTALVLLGGAGVAVALTTGAQRDLPPAAAPAPPATTAPAPMSTAATGPATAAPAPSDVARVPLALRAVSTGKPAVVATIRVGAEPEGIAVSPDGRTVYVANQSSRVLSVVDAASRRVTAVHLRHTPRFVTTSRDGRLVFVSMYENDKSGSGVAVVDAAGRKVVRYLATGVQPFTLAVGPDDRLWVPIHSNRRVEIYATADQRPDGQVNVPPNPHAVAFSASLMRAFTANHESNAVSIIDMRTDRLLKSVPVSRAPHSVAVSPDGGTVLVAGYEANTADLIDAKTMRRTGPFRVGKKPQSVAFAGDGGHAYVVNEGDQHGVRPGRAHRRGDRDGPGGPQPAYGRGLARRPPGLCVQRRRRHDLRVAGGRVMRRRRALAQSGDPTYYQIVIGRYTKRNDGR